MYDHYVKFEKYGTVHRGKEKAPQSGTENKGCPYFGGERDDLISMLESFLFVLLSDPSGLCCLGEKHSSLLVTTGSDL